jgi:hypothetical protein
MEGVEMKIRFVIGLALGLGALVGGCKGGATPIGELLDDPTKHEGQIVRIQGTVEEAVGALGYGGYRVDDGTGKILVITNTGGAPRTGARVGVEGEFRAAFTFGTNTLAALIEKERRTK